VALALALLAGMGALLETCAYDSLLSRKDVRDRAEDWIQAHVPAGATLGLPESPWFDTAPVIPLNVHIPPDDLAQLQKRSPNLCPFHLTITGFGASRLEALKPQYYLLTEWQIRYRERLFRVDPRGTSEAAQAGRQAEGFLQALHRMYRPVATFRARPALGPLVFRWPFVPDDWLYPNPTQWIYELKSDAPTDRRP
jgi:hypothetical protein